MEGRPRVLGPECGPATARCLVLAEAPGERGAAQTGVPLHGDHTGEHFEQLLAESGIRRQDLFVSNVVLCSPGRRKPSRSEIVRCSTHVRALIDCLDPAIVVTLGAVALESTEHLEPHGFSRSAGTSAR